MKHKLLKPMLEIKFNVKRNKMHDYTIFDIRNMLCSMRYAFREV
jgi:hypothetical protein